MTWGDDDHAGACLETYAMLRAYHDSALPEELSAALGLAPSSSASVGSTENPLGLPLGQSVWGLSSKGVVLSRDCRTHIDWLIGRLRGKERDVARLQEAGWEFDLMVPWTRGGYGGPYLMPDQMTFLGRLGLPIWFPIHAPGVPDQP